MQKKRAQWQLKLLLIRVSPLWGLLFTFKTVYSIGDYDRLKSTREYFHSTFDIRSF
jgi:hypothetical protein